MADIQDGQQYDSWSKIILIGIMIFSEFSESTVNVRITKN